MQCRFHGVSTALLALASLACAGPAAARVDYVAGIDVQHGETAPEEATGVVFHDLDRDGVWQEDEPGVAGVIVTNGRDVTVTDRQGRYALPVFDNMTVMVHKPAAWTVPVNEDGVPQFSYTHKPGGTPEPLRYGGLAPTGPLPDAINFPMIRTGVDDAVLLRDDGRHPDLFEHRTGLCARRHPRRSCVARPLRGPMRDHARRCRRRRPRPAAPRHGPVFGAGAAAILCPRQSRFRFRRDIGRALGRHVA